MSCDRVHEGHGDAVAEVSGAVDGRPALLIPYHLPLSPRKRAITDSGLLSGYSLLGALGILVWEPRSGCLARRTAETHDGRVHETSPTWVSVHGLVGFISGYAATFSALLVQARGPASRVVEEDSHVHSWPVSGRVRSRLLVTHSVLRLGTPYGTMENAENRGSRGN